MARSAGWTPAVLATFVVLVLLAALLPARPAFACSCAEMTLESVAERDPDAAVARILRVDGGTNPGTGRVVDTIVGELPEQVPLHLDDGASCRPAVAVGELAVLAFEPVGDGWRAMECGMLAATTGLPDLVPDLDADTASGATIVLSGRFPGAELVALDDQLRVVATAGRSPAAYGERLHACGDDLVAHGHDEEGRVAVRRLSLPALGPVGEYFPDYDPQVATAEVLDVVCREDGRVDALVLMWHEEPDLQLQRDIFGDVAVSSLPDTTTAAFAGDAVVFAQPANHGAGPLRLFTYDPEADHRRRILEHPMEGANLQVSPDGRHLTVRGYDNDPLFLVVEVASGEVVAEQRGTWQPAHRPWVGDDRLLLLDEGHHGRGDGQQPAYRLVDLELREVAGLAGPGHGLRTTNAGQLLSTSSHGIEVYDLDDEVVRSRDALWAAGAADALLLSEVSQDPGAEPLRGARPVAAADPQPSAADPAAPVSAFDGSDRLFVAGLVVAVAVAVAVVVVRLRTGRTRGE